MCGEVTEGRLIYRVLLTITAAMGITSQNKDLLRVKTKNFPSTNLDCVGVVPSQITVGLAA